MSGFKAAKDFLLLLLKTKIVEDPIHRPLLIYQSEKPSVHHPPQKAPSHSLRIARIKVNGIFLWFNFFLPIFLLCTAVVLSVGVAVQNLGCYKS